MTTSYLDVFTTNLNQVIAADPTEYGAFGRDVELGRLVRILNQHTDPQRGFVLTVKRFWLVVVVAFVVAALILQP